MFAKLPASKPCCCGSSGTTNSVVGGISGTCPTGVPPPPLLPLGVNDGALLGVNAGVLPPPVLRLNGLTPLRIEPGVGLPDPVPTSFAIFCPDL